MFQYYIDRLNEIYTNYLNETDLLIRNLYIEMIEHIMKQLPVEWEIENAPYYNND